MSRRLDWSASVLACMFREDSNRDGCAPVEIKLGDYAAEVFTFS